MSPRSSSAPAEPARDCRLCPRLSAFIEIWREREPAWHNAPVPTSVASGGDATVRLLVAGLAPGLRGANRTGLPFTGDQSGELLHATMQAHGFARGAFEGRVGHGLKLVDAAITNAVRCVPPDNRPAASEINTCRPFLAGTIERFAKLRVIVTLGKIAHDSTVRALGGRTSIHPFKHEAVTAIGGLTIVSSYHCSRYNINTGRLTPAMFDKVFAKARAIADG